MIKSVPIQPKTSNILPKFCQKLATTLRVVLVFVGPVVPNEKAALAAQGQLLVAEGGRLKAVTRSCGR